MKKITFYTLLLAMILSATLLVSCTSAVPIDPKEPELMPYVSYAEDTLLMASGESFNVEVIFFKTEEPKAMDGKIASPLVRKVKIAYIPLKLGGIDQKVSYQYLGSSGELQKSAVRYELCAEFETTQEVALSMQLNIASKLQAVTLTNITEGKMTPNEALTLATDGLKTSLKEELTQDFSREIIIKIIPDQMSEKPFFYYISFFKSPDNFSAVLIDPTTKKIVTKKEEA